MDSYVVTLAPSAKGTRMLVTRGPDKLLRAVLPTPSAQPHPRAVATLLEGMALWLDQTLLVVLCVGADEASSCLGLTDEMGVGHHSVFYRVEVRERGRRRRRGSRIGGIAPFADLRQLCLDLVGRSRA